MADAPGAVPPDERRKKTILLLSGGAASLLLPLAGLAYIHWADSRPVAGPEGASDVFEHHDGQGPVVPSQVTPNVVALPPGGAVPKPVSSLDFIKSDPEFAARAPGAAPGIAAAPGPAGSAAAAAAPAAAASTTTATSAAAAKKNSASTKKQFVMPKLQPGRGFTNFGSTGAGAAAAQQGAAAGAQANPQQMLQNLPPGAQNNPEIQKYLQSQQGH